MTPLILMDVEDKCAFYVIIQPIADYAGDTYVLVASYTPQWQQIPLEDLCWPHLVIVIRKECSTMIVGGPKRRMFLGREIPYRTGMQLRGAVFENYCGPNQR